VTGGGKKGGPTIVFSMFMRGNRFSLELTPCCPHFPHFPLFVFYFFMFLRLARAAFNLMLNRTFIEQFPVRSSSGRDTMTPTMKCIVVLNPYLPPGLP